MFEEQARGLLEGGVDLVIIETAQDILEVKAAIFGIREAFKAAGRSVPIQCSVSLLPQGGKMLLGTDISAVLATLEALRVDAIGLNCSTGPEDMRDAIRFLGELSPVPVHCIPNAGLPLQGPNGETIFPEQPEPLADGAGRVRRALRHLDRRRLLRDHAGAHRGAGRSGPRPRPGRASAAAPAARIEHDRRHPAGPGPDAHAGRRAGELAGLAQGQGAAAGRRLRRDPHDRRGPGRGRRARARRVRGADRAPGRGRADAPGRQADLADPAGPDPGRLDRARGDRDRPPADPGPSDRQLRQPRGRPRQARPGGAPRPRPRRGADRADDRRGRDGQDRRAQARGRSADHRAVL